MRAGAGLELEIFFTVAQEAGFKDMKVEYKTHFY